MSRKNLLLTIAALLMISLSAISLQSAPVWAQSPTTPAPKTGGFSLKLKIVGVVHTLTATQLTLADGTVIELKGLKLPANVTVGKTVTIFAEVDDNQFVAKRIALGGTVTSPAATPAATSAATAEPTEEATGEPTEEAPVAATHEADCAEPEAQATAARLSAAFNMPTSEILSLHCQGVGFGDIAKANLVARMSAQSGKTPLTVAQILDMLRAGKSWADIFQAAGINPKDLRPGSVQDIEVENQNEVEVEVENEHPQGDNSQTGKGEDDKKTPDHKEGDNKSGDNKGQDSGQTSGDDHSGSSGGDHSGSGGGGDNGGSGDH